MDSFTKRLLYFGPGSLSMAGYGTVLQKHYTILENAIKRAKASDSANIELPLGVAENLLQDSHDAAYYKGKYNSTKEELDELQERLKDARDYYLNSNERPEKRNSQVVQKLGISKGVRQARIDRKALYCDYFELVIEKEMAKETAIDRLTTKYGIATADACIALLQKECARVRKEFKDQGHSAAHLDHYIPARPSTIYHRFSY